MTKIIPTGLMPVACRVGNGFVPVIFHPDHGPERYPRKAKFNPDDAIAYATRVIWWRQRRAAEKRRRLEALSHPRFATWAEYQAATPEQQRASWNAILADWQANHERELDADVCFDYSADRRTMWEACE